MRRLFWIMFIPLFLMPVATTSAQAPICPPQLIESANRLISQAQEAIALGQYDTADTLLTAAQELLTPCYGGASHSPTAIAPTPFATFTPPPLITPTPSPTFPPTNTPTPLIPTVYQPELELNTVQLSFGTFNDDTRGVDFMPNGLYALASSFDYNLYLFDVNTAEQVRVFSGHTDWAFNADFTRDGTIMASASADDTIRIWDVATATTLEVLSEHDENVTNVAFSPDATRLVSTGQDNRVIVWDTATWEVIADLRGHTDWVWDVSFSPDGAFFVTVASDDIGIVWSTDSLTQVGLLMGHQDIVISVEYSPDGLYILTGSHDGTAILWDAATFEPIRAYQGSDIGSRAIMDVAFSPDMRLVAAASFGGFVHIWQITGDPIATYTGHSGAGVWAVQFSPDSQTFLSGADDGGMLLNRVRE